MTTKKKNNTYDEFRSVLKSKKFTFSENEILNCTVKSININDSDWLAIITITAKLSYRWLAIWACQINDEFQINSCFEKNGQYLLLRTNIPISHSEISSITSLYPAADRMERHIHDTFGVFFIDHPRLIRWTRHKAWEEHEFPLGKDFSSQKNYIESTPPDNDYPFSRVDGSGVCEIPVGPIHAGIIEPGHFRFQIAGEDVLELEERLGYVHKGIEKIAEGKSAEQLIRLASRVSGDTTVAHAWTACQACENAGRIDVPKRALFIRAIMCERERIANHLGDIGAICNDVGFAFAYYQFGRLRELWQRLNSKIFGHRFMMDCLVVGGVKNDLDNSAINELVNQINIFKNETAELFAIIENNSSLQDRLKTTGILTNNIAKRIGTVGYVAKASGINYDLRKDSPYFPYNELTFKVATTKEGDVAARLKIRADEIVAAFDILEQLLIKLPNSELIAKGNFSFSNSEGLGLIESWRGEILTYVSFDNAGKVARFFPRDASWLNWPALEHLIHNNIVPDFPVCNKSINGSYSGHDL